MGRDDRDERRKPERGRDERGDRDEARERFPEDNKAWRGTPQTLQGSGFAHYDLVQQAHQELKAEGKIFPTDEHTVEQHKGLVTRRAGYYANLQDPQIGILEKTTGNNSEGYSVDILIYKSGQFNDVVTSHEQDGQHMAEPVNGGPSGPDPELVPRWRQPTKALAGLEGSTPSPGPTPPTEPLPGGSLLDRDIRPFDVAYATFVSDASEFDRLGREWYRAWSGREPALSDLHHGYWRCMLEREQWVTPRNAFNDAWPLPPEQQPQMAPTATTH